jgi:membrane protease YdiL (CAAX protease family)
MRAVPGAGPVAPGNPPGAPAAPQSGAFSRVRSRWLVLWALVGGAVAMWVASVLNSVVGGDSSSDLAGVLLYLPIAAWVWFVVVRRNGVDLSVMLRWPRLGAYWWIVAGLFVVQLLFSVGAITLTNLVFPGLTESLEGVGQGSLLLAVISLVILPPLVEEVVFRGVLLERFAVKWRIGVAIVVSAVAFGILHADPVGAGVFGAMTALLYLRTGSLWPGILIHFANNLLALVATRTSPGTEAPEMELGEALTSAGLFLAMSVPFLVWFFVRTWPRRGSLTPYQQHELGSGGLAPASFIDVFWSAATVPVRLAVTSTHLIVDRPGLGGQQSQPLAVLPIEQVAAAYTSDVPGGQQVVVLLDDGSWTTMRVGPGAPGPNRELAAAITDRAAAARGAGVASAQY